MIILSKFNPVYGSSRREIILMKWGQIWNGVSFVPLLVRSTMEYGVFDNEDRGSFWSTSVGIRALTNELHDANRCKLTDEKYLHVMKRLKVQETYFPKKRLFEFLSSWKPEALSYRSPTRRWVLLHNVTDAAWVSCGICSWSAPFSEADR